jgi:DNA polymerase-3 subunit alpha
MYLKIYHPKEFICAWINSYKGKTEKLPDCISEAHRLNVKVYNPVFRKAEGKTFLYNDGIMVGVGAIKYCNTQIADELMNLSSNKYNSFINLLSDINSNTSINSKQLTILTGLNFFSTFGSNKYLLEVIDIYNKFYSCKIIKKDKIEELGLSEYYMKKYAGKETEKQYSDLDNLGIINELCLKLENKPMSIVEHIKFELEYLGYTTYTNPAVSEFYYIVLEFKTYKDATRPYLVLRNIKTGDENKARITQGKIFKESTFGQFSVLKIKEFEKCFKKKNIGGDWVVTDEIEDVLESYEVIK